MTVRSEAVARESQLAGEEELIAVLSSWSLSRAGETGYGLVITKGRVIGARRIESDSELVAYLGSGSSATEADRKKAAITASLLLSRRQFSLSRSKIAQILFREPSYLDGGYVVFKTSLEAHRVQIPVVSGWNGDPVYVSRVLLSALRTFSPERLYDGRTGALYVEESLKMAAVEH